MTRCAQTTYPNFTLGDPCHPALGYHRVMGIQPPRLRNGGHTYQHFWERAWQFLKVSPARDFILVHFLKFNHYPNVLSRVHLPSYRPASLW
jgi:hypothetical protein